MTDGRFHRVQPRSAGTDRVRIAERNFADSLADIRTYLVLATEGGRDAFFEGSSAYASGCVAIIRAAALFEQDEFEMFLTAVPETVARGVRTTRNIVAHSGYRSMDDDVFWTTLDVHLRRHLDDWALPAEP